MKFDDLVADAAKLDYVTEAQSVEILLILGTLTELFVALVDFGVHVGADAYWLTSDGTRRRVLVVHGCSSCCIGWTFNGPVSLLL